MNPRIVTLKHHVALPFSRLILCIPEGRFFDHDKALYFRLTEYLILVGEILVADP